MPLIGPVNEILEAVLGHGAPANIGKAAVARRTIMV